MSYEGLEKARAKRAKKEATKEAKGNSKRGQKRKSAALVAEPLEAKVARILESKAQESVSVSATQISRTLVTPVARMW